MNTLFAISLDGTRIAYDVTGEGSALVLLHGGGHTRQNWHDVGYVERLKNDYKMIAIDIRGNGESDKRIDPTDYTIEKLCQDILAVADACSVERFSIWGCSYGGNIGRYLAAQSDRVEKLIIMGIPFGLGASGDFRRYIENFHNRWQPILEAKRRGTLDITSLSTEDQRVLWKTNIAVEVARLSAILDWRAIEPTAIGCQTLWLIGSEDEPAMASLQAYREVLKISKVRAAVIEGSDHLEEFTKIDQSLPVMLAFMNSEA